MPNCDVIVREYRAEDEQQWLRCRVLSFLNTAYLDHVLRSRALLKGIGIEGELIPTPGHSDDSISLVTDEGHGLTGDLPALAEGPRDLPKNERNNATARVTDAIEGFRRSQ